MFDMQVIKFKVMEGQIIYKIWKQEEEVLA